MCSGPCLRVSEGSKRDHVSPNFFCEFCRPIKVLSGKTAKRFRLCSDTSSWKFFSSDFSFKFLAKLCVLFADVSWEANGSNASFLIFFWFC